MASLEEMRSRRELIRGDLAKLGEVIVLTKKIQELEKEEIIQLREKHNSAELERAEQDELDLLRKRVEKSHENDVRQHKKAPSNQELRDKAAGLLKEFRLANGVTYPEIAKALGTSIYMLEKIGKRANGVSLEFVSWIIHLLTKNKEQTTVQCSKFKEDMIKRQGIDPKLLTLPLEELRLEAAKAVWKMKKEMSWQELGEIIGISHDTLKRVSLCNGVCGIRTLAWLITKYREKN